MPRSSAPTFSMECSAASLAELGEAMAALVVLGYPLAGEGAVLNGLQHLLHVLFDVLVDDDRAAGQVSVLGRVADGVAHVLHAAPG